MRSVTVDGLPAWLVDHPADWVAQPTLRLTVPVSIERGLTGRESRRAEGATLRAEMDWQSVLRADQAQSLLAGLQQYLGAPIIAPVWPMAVCTEFTATPLVGGLFVAWRNDASEWAIGSAIGDPLLWDWIAPALWGSFLRLPESSALTPELFRVAFSVREDGPAVYALVPPSTTFAPGPALPDGSTPPVFPWPVNWTDATRSATADIDAERRDLGPGRETAPAIYPQEAERPVEGLVTLSTASQAADFFAWWVLQGGNAGGHWTPSLAAPTRLSADVAAGATTLPVVSGAGLAPELSLRIQNSFGISEVGRISGVAGNVVTMAAPLARAWEKDEAVLFPLMLARHARATAELLFHTQAIAEARIAWREVAGEDVLPSEEVRGATIGRLLDRAWLYTMETDRGGVVSVDRFTSFERDLVVQSQAFVSRPCDHSEIRQTIRLDRDEISLSLRWWEACPLAAFLPGRLDTAVRLVVEVCEPQGTQGINPRRVFSGQVRSVEFDGPFLQATAAGASSLFDRAIPTILMETVCNWDVYGVGCGLDREAWRFSANVSAVSGAKVTVNSIEPPAGGSIPQGFGFADWFALGVIARGDRQSASFISRSTAIDSGSITLDLDRVLSPQVLVGQTVTLIPGCDGRAATCKLWNSTGNPAGKFNNFTRFGGFPEIPATNPIVQPIGKPSGGGKK
jgi:hypothetical protein